MTQPENSDSEHVQIDVSDLEKWIQVYQKARKKIAELEEMRDTAKAKITEALEREGADEGTIDGKTVVTWHKQVRRNFDSKSFRVAYPELADEYTKVTETRTFLPKVD